MQSWQNFFFMCGSASATLSALMFIAITFGAKLITKETLERAETFFSPIWFHFVQVFTLSAIALMPLSTPYFLAFACLIGGLWRIAHVPGAVRVMKDAASENQDIEMSDWWLGLLLPAGCYLALTIIGVLFFSIPEIATEGLAFVMVALMLIAMRQAWDMLLWIATKLE